MDEANVETSGCDAELSNNENWLFPQLERVAGMVRRYRELEVPVWRFLADQLLLPMAIGAGGKYLTVPPSRHSQTNLEVIRKFLDIEIKLENRKNGQYCIEVKK